MNQAYEFNNKFDFCAGGTETEYTYASHNLDRSRFLNDKFSENVAFTQASELINNDYSEFCIMINQNGSVYKKSIKN